MDTKFLKAVEVVLRHEGGYVNHPDDPGGETNFGITKRTYPHLDIRALAREDAIRIYHQDWWLRYRYNQIDDTGVATKVFDLSVNMGPSGGHRILQRAINWTMQDRLKVDGIIGPLSIGAANRGDSKRILQAMRFKAAEYYYSLAKARPASRTFLMGWLNRAYS